MVRDDINDNTHYNQLSVNENIYDNDSGNKSFELPLNNSISKRKFWTTQEVETIHSGFSDMIEYGTVPTY